MKLVSRKVESLKLLCIFFFIRECQTKNAICKIFKITLGYKCINTIVIQIQYKIKFFFYLEMVNRHCLIKRICNKLWPGYVRITYPDSNPDPTRPDGKFSPTPTGRGGGKPCYRAYPHVVPPPPGGVGGGGGGAFSICGFIVRREKSSHASLFIHIYMYSVN